MWSPDLQKAERTYMDMNPIASRTNTVPYRIQPQYIPDTQPQTRPDRDVLDDRTHREQTLPGSFSENSYTQRLASEGSDARNMIRELRSAVVENNADNQIHTDRLLTERQFGNRWLPPKAATDIASLQAYELLRPKTDSWREQ